jgi:hypothetical protein
MRRFWKFLSAIADFALTQIEGRNSRRPAERRTEPLVSVSRIRHDSTKKPPPERG